MLDGYTYRPRINTGSPASMKLCREAKSSARKNVNSTPGFTQKSEIAHGSLTERIVLEESRPEQRTVKEMLDARKQGKNAASVYQSIYDRVKRSSLLHSCQEGEPGLNYPVTCRHTSGTDNMASGPTHEIRTERSGAESFAGLQDYRISEVVMRNNEWLANKEEKLARERQAKELNQTAGCTFKPLLVAKGGKANSRENSYVQPGPMVKLTPSELRILSSGRSYTQINQVRSRSKTRGQSIENLGQAAIC